MSTPLETDERLLEAVVGPAPGDMADCSADQAVIEMPFDELAATLRQTA